jgi:hypothetical protein
VNGPTDQQDGPAGMFLMTSSEIQRAARRPFISVVEFAIFQIAATWGVAFAAYYLTASAAEIGSLIDRNISIRVHWILTENPYFPVQILLALYSGWMSARIFKKKPNHVVGLDPATFYLNVRGDFIS